LKPESLLIIRPDRVGDVVISTSCLPAARESLPESRIFFAAPAAMGPLFRGHPFLDGFIPLPPPAASWRQIWKRAEELAERLEPLKIRAVAHLQPDPACYLACQRLGIPKRVGWNRVWWSWALTDGLPYVKHEGRKHEAEYNLDLLRPLGVEARRALRPSLAPDPEARLSLLKKLPESFGLRPYALFHLSAYSSYLRWPAEKFAEAAREVEKRFGCMPVLIGADAEDPAHAAFRELVPGCIDLSGKTSLAELAWLAKDARVLVTRDTGPSHIASGMGCPVVAVFARVEPIYGPVRWSPLGDRVETVAPQRPPRRWWENKRGWWREGIRGVPSSQVLAAVEKLLGPA
jgi:ADP-heptose:LPS heptosyltransferase